MDTKPLPYRLLLAFLRLKNEKINAYPEKLTIEVMAPNGVITTFLLFKEYILIKSTSTPNFYLVIPVSIMIGYLNKNGLINIENTLNKADLLDTCPPQLNRGLSGHKYSEFYNSNNMIINV